MGQIYAPPFVLLTSISTLVASTALPTVTNALMQLLAFDVLQLMLYQMESVLKLVIQLLLKNLSTMLAFVLHVINPARLVLAEDQKDVEAALLQELS